MDLEDETDNFDNRVHSQVIIVDSQEYFYTFMILKCANFQGFRSPLSFRSNRVYNISV